MPAILGWCGRLVGGEADRAEALEPRKDVPGRFALQRTAGVVNPVDGGAVLDRRGRHRGYERVRRVRGSAPEPRLTSGDDVRVGAKIRVAVIEQKEIVAGGCVDEV